MASCHGVLKELRRRYFPGNPNGFVEMVAEREMQVFNVHGAGMVDVVTTTAYGTTPE
jgi:hypothetical protein